MKFDEVLRRFSGFFEGEGIRYALIGGLAMQAWGRSRLTKDIDFAVDASARDRVIGFANPSERTWSRPKSDSGLL